jgi:deazaflavin-dependent oxidoreductase (nitroreductase family)
LPNDNEKVIETLRNGDAATAEEWAATGTTVPPNELLILHTIGVRSGEPRLIPLRYHDDSGRYVVFASNGGSSTDPNWFRNLMAQPASSIEFSDEMIAVVATVAEGEERARIWRDQVARYPHFAEYETRAGRAIPVVILTPAESSQRSRNPAPERQDSS